MRERLKNLLSVLVNIDSDPIDVLATQFKVTPRTIRNEVREINDLLASNQLPLFQVKKGMINNQLLGDQQREQALQVILSDRNQNYLNPQQRLLYLLLSFLISKEPVFIIDVQEQLIISKSTMDSDMRDLRALLKPYNLELTTDLKNGAHVAGNERTIRMVFCDLIIRQINRNTLFDKTSIESNDLIDRLRTDFPYQNLQLIDRKIKGEFYNEVSHR